MIKQTVAFLDAVHSYKIFHDRIKALVPETKSVLGELPLAERWLMRYPFPIKDRKLRARQLTVRLHVREKLMPHTMPVTLGMVDFWEQCFIFGASISLVDDELLADVAAGFADGRKQAATALAEETKQLKAELRELTAYDA